MSESETERESEPVAFNRQMTWPMDAATTILLEEVPEEGLRIGNLSVHHIDGRDAYYVSREDTPVGAFEKGAFSTGREILSYLSKHTGETFEVNSPDGLPDYDEWGVQ